MRSLTTKVIMLCALVAACGGWPTLIAQTSMTGGPIPGAQIFLEQEPDDEPIAVQTTNENGEVAFGRLPESYSLSVGSPIMRQRTSPNHNTSRSNLASPIAVSDATGVEAKLRSFIVKCPSGVFRLQFIPGPGLAGAKITPVLDVLVDRDGNTISKMKILKFTNPKAPAQRTTQKFSLLACEEKDFVYQKGKTVEMKVVNGTPERKLLQEIAEKQYGINEE